MTSLNDDDSDVKVMALCQQARSPAGFTAAVCDSSRFILARKSLRELAEVVRIATVTNFQGNQDIDDARRDPPLWPMAPMR